MSRIGLKPIELPAGVEVSIGDNNMVTVKGPKGQLQEQLSSLITIERKDNVITLSRDDDTKEKREQHGLARALLNNMVTGVAEGFTKKLELVGVGYKAEKKGKTLVLNLGFSHPVELEDPEVIETSCPSANEITVSGADKVLVGNYAADIRALRKPEPYKGKGIRCDGEHVRRKEGKAGVTTSA